MRYLLYVIALVLIFASWYWHAGKFIPLLKGKGFKLKKTELYGLLFVMAAILLALLFTYWQTEGSFIWG